MHINPGLDLWVDNRSMGMFNPAWFSQLADTARKLVLDDRHVDRPHRPSASAPAAAGFSADEPLWVVWASQTGVAEALAHDVIDSLQEAGITASNIPFDTLQLSALESATQVVFVVSTTYDGDPPDMAEAFRDSAMRQPASLPHLRYGLLALGDRGYDDFCGFGRQLHAWLQASNARAWFEPIELDDEDQHALQLWREQLRAMSSLAIGDRKGYRENGTK